MEIELTQSGKERWNKIRTKIHIALKQNDMVAAHREQVKLDIFEQTHLLRNANKIDWHFPFSATEH